MASAGIPNACAFSNSPLILDAPSSSENSVCVCRWTKLFAAIGSREAPPIDCHAGLGVEVIPEDPVDNVGISYMLVILPARRLHSAPAHGQDGEPESPTMKLSYSSIDTYETCPARYKFQYEDKLPRQETPALSFGDVLHRVLYRFHNRPVPVAPSLEEMHEMLEDEWSDKVFTTGSDATLYREHAWQI